MFLNDFFNLVLVCKDIKPKHGRTKTRGFFSTVSVVSSIRCFNILTNYYRVKEVIKNILNYCKLFKNKARLGNNFLFKEQIAKDLTYRVVYKFQRELCNESY